MSKTILLVHPARSRNYYTTYPPLGLLKYAQYHRSLGDIVHLVRGPTSRLFNPDIIYITSLFTYSWRPVHDCIRSYRKRYPRARILVGGIYASLLPDKIREEFSDSVEIITGVNSTLDDIIPDYSLVPKWDTSLIISSRGCPRKCSFCSVPILEPDFIALKSISHLVLPWHRKIMFWDNNILASPYCLDIFHELASFHKQVDFNQGLDARLLTPPIVEAMTNISIPYIRMSFDIDSMHKPLDDAISLLQFYGRSNGHIFVFVLYNHDSGPDQFFFRCQFLLNRGCAVYPMRYEPYSTAKKRTYISPFWTEDHLNMVARAQGAMGFNGVFSPSKLFIQKFNRANNFTQAFKLNNYPS